MHSAMARKAVDSRTARQLTQQRCDPLTIVSHIFIAGEVDCQEIAEGNA